MMFFSRLFHRTMNSPDESKRMKLYLWKIEL